MKILSGAEVKDEQELQEVLEINRLRMVYEDMVSRTTGRGVTYPVTGFGKNVDRNVKLFSEINRRLKVLDVAPEKFMTVMFQQPKNGTGWKYPYLQFLATDKAVEIFRYRMERMSSLYGKSLPRVLKATEGGNFDEKFRNAFLGGFYALDNTRRGSPIGFFRKSENLFATFLAYSDIFKPEFVVTSHYAERFLGVKKKTRTGIIVTQAVVRYIDPVLNNRTGLAHDNKRYFSRLLESRERVRNEEGKVLKQKHELTETKGKETWKLLR